MPPSPSARVLVLGGAGMLGHALIRHLRQDAALVVQWTSRRGEDGGVAFDVRDESTSIDNLLDRLSPLDYVVNCIAVLQGRIDERDADSLRRAEEINGVFPQRLAEAARQRGVRVIHVSTDGVFAADADVCVEDTPAAPMNVYGRTKLQGEVQSKNVLNIRCSLLGPASENGRGLLEWLMRQPSATRLSGFVDQLWTGCTTRQFAELSRRLIVEDLFAAAAGEGGIHHFCPIAPLSKYELLRALAKLLRPDIEICPVESGQPVTRRLDTSKQTLHRILPKYAPLDLALERLSLARNTK